MNLELVPNCISLCYVVDEDGKVFVYTSHRVRILFCWMCKCAINSAADSEQLGEHDAKCNMCKFIFRSVV